jgi:hypothetical protein
VPDAHPAAPSTAPASADAIALPRDARWFLETHRYGVVGTVNPDCSPHQAVVWYLVEPTPDQQNGYITIVINSRQGRRWPSNLQRDPRIRFAVYDGHDWVGVSGVVTIQDDQPTAQHDIATMARLNDTPEEAAEAIATFETQERVSFRFRPTAFHAEIEAGAHTDEGS